MIQCTPERSASFICVRFRNRHLITRASFACRAADVNPRRSLDRKRYTGRVTNEHRIRRSIGRRCCFWHSRVGTGQCGNRTAAIRRVVVKPSKRHAHTYIIAYRNYMRLRSGSRTQECKLGNRRWAAADGSYPVRSHT